MRVVSRLQQTVRYVSFDDLYQFPVIRVTCVGVVVLCRFIHVSLLPPASLPAPPAAPPHALLARAAAASQVVPVPRLCGNTFLFGQRQQLCERYTSGVGILDGGAV